ncbi:MULTISPECIES: XRE family transcriptional regulator [unclassified Fusobacterium]|uniref:helix-turn-helix domain-containing protein n=1 Tax=unclassified Fusobacterium TaxID=2648384 RepID=UPI001B8AD0D7|nr:MULTISPECIES: XRE family transcriptional regulator [unclassified Fusobacterium]MBR8701295.1 LexA repressor [Fusobacterium sp. DD45]MBR8711089.1 LexA repressor [Fusobacterium sp. DD28]MBR8751663.1 LexA repressor [Fusobacterium sp. DD26]
MKAGEYIKSIRKQRGLSLRQVAYKTGLSHTYISDIEKGNLVGTNETHEKILSGLNFNEQEKNHFYQLLIEDKAVPPYIVEKIKKLEKEIENLNKDSITNVHVTEKNKKIPVFSNICAGNGGCEADIISHITVPVDGIFTGDVFAVRVDGDSMEHTIEDKSIVFIKKDVEVPNNRIGAFILNNESYLKRLCKMGDSIFLRSDNRDYPDIHVQPSDDFIVVGRYIGTIMNTDE